ncbi:acyltransferase [Aliarcobacter cryaerophilus]|uniref:acyltransferase n=1 Tax=Aliarcobacter cryaerophilus TaxID=28198 RepID=UPI0021B3481D|nr:acyltransferase [Aliarcobacter cryaerophilus]MCT7544578.1 acyltransferase [Aliarcobacter cryaerophilus]
MKKTRISSNVKIIRKNKLDIRDNVWVWHHTILDASGENGIIVGEGCQIGAWVGIFTHSSHIAIRLLGEKYITLNQRIGYVNGGVEIGDYTFIGAGCYILPGVKIGKGCLISAGSIVTKSVPEYSIVSGNPAKVIASTLKFDKKYFKEKIVQENYFDKEIIENWLNNKEREIENANTIS